MAKSKKPAAGKAEQTTMEKIGDTVSHIKDILVEKKDQLVEVIEEKAADLKGALKKFKKKKAAKKKAVKKVKTAKKAVRKPTKKAAKKAVAKTVKKTKTTPKKKK